MAGRDRRLSVRYSQMRYLYRRIDDPASLGSTAKATRRVVVVCIWGSEGTDRGTGQ